MILKWKKRKTQLGKLRLPTTETASVLMGSGYTAHEWEVFKAAWWRRAGGRAIMSQKGEFEPKDGAPRSPEFTPGSENH